LKYKNIYIAATSQHVGKTTSTLGLVAAFQQQGLNVGYCKPVGQKHLTVDNAIVDKDTVLFGDLLNFHIEPTLHSPIIFHRGATKEHIEDPGGYSDLQDKVLHSAHILGKRHEIVVYEGTGHPGVGSVANVSNAEVAHLLDASVVMVVEAGIGSTIDQLNLCCSLFREKSVPIIGVIVNKVKVDYLEKVQYYLGKKLEEMGMPLLGCVPYDKSLAYPLMKTIASAINASIIMNDDRLNNKVADYLAGSLTDLEKINKLEDILMVVSSRRVNEAITRLEMLKKNRNIESETPLAGIVVTGTEKLEGRIVDYAEEYKIPVLRTFLDTYEVVLKISRIEVKINVNTPWKVQRAIELIEKHVNTQRILETQRL
jgi:BioD-like phosphotransacetylase family protein